MFLEFYLDAQELKDLDFNMSFDYKYFDTLELMSPSQYLNRFIIFLVK